MATDANGEKIARLEQELKQSRAREKALGDLLEKKLNEIYFQYHIARAVGSTLDLQEMLMQVIDIIRKSISLDRISVYLADKERKNLDLVYYSGLDLARRAVLPVGAGAPGRIVERGEHIHIHDLSSFYENPDDFIHHPGEEKRGGAYIGIALRAHNETIGAIGMDTETRHGLTVENMDFMAILSHEIAAGIEKSLLFGELEALAQLDGLTGLYNRRVFREKLLREVSRRGRTGMPLALVMIDIDHFKQFNDNYGHQAGDEVLKELSRIIRSQFRCNTIDSCCRYGGEEFAVIMPELEFTRACRVAERLRRMVEESTFVVGHERIESKMTISLGVACLTGKGDGDPETLVKKADDALYRAKRNGRNQISCSADESA